MIEQNYFARGKILLFGEYFVLFGSKALAVPTQIGQKLYVQSKKSFDPKLIWESYDEKGEKWFDVEMDLWHFRAKDDLNDDLKVAHETLQRLLAEVRKENPHFLREKEQVTVRTELEFPLSWGLGSSSSLISNVASWAKVNPYDLGARTFGGSGYDIACSNSRGPIVYQKDKKKYERSPFCLETNFTPHFEKNLFFVYLGKKENTREHLQKIKDKKLKVSDEALVKVNTLIDNVLHCDSLGNFEKLISEYEKMVEDTFGISRIKQELFPEYWGEIKSLGAWGGDFILATSDKDVKVTKKFFQDKGFDTFFSYSDLVNSSACEIQAKRGDENVSASFLL